ncbi:uncharacterized protein LOC108999190 [Juglans regia]|uniref:Uncharacterized protein LOC108999190 n=1 Tax=Juglans regia TaxID=51240 RepID=A0A6P9E8F6_JUGRE|nr:uncharacterized protein LOC108999190 [Juglans regia]
MMIEGYDNLSSPSPSISTDRELGAEEMKRRAMTMTLLVRWKHLKRAGPRHSSISIQQKKSVSSASRKGMKASMEKEDFEPSPCTPESSTDIYRHNLRGYGQFVD